ncbi:hypothetical protein G9A89_010262 [Geosiphon pyriformis]|nr:hypothetical protein G9A89_010262 [Geosiphon pyriformis]
MKLDTIPINSSQSHERFYLASYVPNSKFELNLENSFILQKFSESLNNHSSSRIPFKIDDDFDYDNFIRMNSLLTQYEAILAYKRKKMLQKEAQSQSQSQSKQYISHSASSSLSLLSSGLFKTEKKFWQFKIQNETTTLIRYGNILPDGTLKERAEQTQLHPSNKNATEFVEKLVQEKIKAGYVKISHKGSQYHTL